MKDERLVGITAADLQAAVEEVGPADGTDAKLDEILMRVIEIAVKRRAEEANGRPFQFLDKVIVQKN